MTYIHTYKTRLDKLVNDGVNENYWGQRDIINKIIILTKSRTDTIHAVIPMKYRKYPSTTILKHANVLAEVNKSP